MKIDGLLSNQAIYDNVKLGLNRQAGFDQALEKAKDNQVKSMEAHKPLDQGQKIQEEKELRQAVEGFEAYFIHQILKQARAGIQLGGFMPESNAKGIYEDMLDQARAEDMTRAGGFGLSQALFDQLRKK